MKSPRFLLRGFRRPSELASLALGRLERQVLEKPGAVANQRARHRHLLNEQVAYTTVMTTLDRLYKKSSYNVAKRKGFYLLAACHTRRV